MCEKNWIWGSKAIEKVNKDELENTNPITKEGSSSENIGIQE